MAEIDIESLDAEIVFSDATDEAGGATATARAEPVAGEMDRLRALIEPLVIDIVHEHYDDFKRIRGG